MPATAWGGGWRIGESHDRQEPFIMVFVSDVGDATVNEIIFLVEEAAEGGYVARALGQSIFTEADDLDALREQVRDAVRCHFEEGQTLRVIRLHFVREEVLTL
jgi:hypothetical protein